MTSLSLLASFVFTLLVLVLLGHYVATSAHPITILRARPEVAFAPADLRVELIVPKSPENRAVEAVCESEDFSRSSTWDLNGADAPTLFPVVWQGLPKGTYTVQAWVFGVSGIRGSDRTTVIRE